MTHTCAVVRKLQTLVIISSLMFRSDGLPRRTKKTSASCNDSLVLMLVTGEGLSFELLDHRLKYNDLRFTDCGLRFADYGYLPLFCTLDHQLKNVLVTGNWSLVTDMSHN